MSARIDGFRAFMVDGSGSAEVITYRAAEWPGILTLARMQTRTNMLAHLAELCREFDSSVESGDLYKASRLYYADIPAAQKEVASL